MFCRILVHFFFLHIFAGHINHFREPAKGQFTTPGGDTTNFYLRKKDILPFFAIKHLGILIFLLKVASSCNYIYLKNTFSINSVKISRPLVAESLQIRLKKFCESSPWYWSAITRKGYPKKDGNRCSSTPMCCFKKGVISNEQKSNLI